jgi:hypothetical protein
MKSGLGRLISFVVVAAGWLLLGARFVVDLIGYSTLPEDAVVASDRAQTILGWLAGINSTVLLLVVFATTALLIWASWPGATFPALGLRRVDLASLAENAKLLIQRIREQQTSNARDASLRPELVAFYYQLGKHRIPHPDDAWDLPPRERYTCHALFLENIRPLLRDGEVRLAREVAQGLVEEIKGVVQERLSPADTEPETQP